MLDPGGTLQCLYESAFPLEGPQQQHSLYIFYHTQKGTFRTASESAKNYQINVSGARGNTLREIIAMRLSPLYCFLT